MRLFAIDACQRNRRAGFTLVEMMVVVVIVSILAAYAVPSFMSMISEQRVRSAASDILGELVSARGEAIKQQRRVSMVRTGVTWKDGWVICLSNAAGACVTTLRTFNGYGNTTTMRVCGSSAAYANQIEFRGDGSIGNAPVGAESGLRISHASGGGGGFSSREIRLSTIGRATVEVFSRGAGVQCP